MAITILDLPAEINAMIVSYVGEGRSHPITRGNFHVTSSALERYVVRGCLYGSDLANLRLVNKTFSVLASPLLFRYIDFCVGMGKEAAFRKFQAICRSRHAIHVRELVLTICHCPKDSKKKFEGFSEASKQQFEKELTAALSCLTNLETMQWVFWCFSSWCSENQHSILFEAVMRIDLLKLKNLYIVVFGLPNYPKLFPELTGASRERVKRLLRQIRCLWIDQYGHEFTHGDGYPSPGHDFTAWFVRALQHEVDRDPVSPPQGTMTAAQAHSFHLETIFLENIPVSLHVLRSLTTLARQTLKRVQLWRVIAYSCGWRDLLSLLNRLPHLTFFRLQGCRVTEETGNFAHTHIGAVDDVSLEDEFSEDKPADDMEPDIDLSGDVEVAVLEDIAFSRRFPMEMLPAFARLLRHVDVNRSAAGMRPLMEEFECKTRR